jgi:hypothetical protein
MIVLAERNPHLAGKIHQRDGEGADDTRNSNATPRSCWTWKNALMNATITIKVIAMLAITAQKIARLIMAARRSSRGKSALSRDLTASSSAMALSAMVRSTIRLRRTINSAIKAASAPSRNAGAAACEITCDNWLTDGISVSIAVKPSGYA